MDYKKYIKSYPNFPKDGVLFWDFSYLLRNVEARNAAISEMLTFLKDKNINKIAAIEAKGFTIGSILAHELQLPLILIRKPNLTPDLVYIETFEKEYGRGEYQIKQDALQRGDNVAIVYDIMAGSGASKAVTTLIERSKANVKGLIYVTELDYLNGRKDLEKYEIFSLVRIDKDDKTH